MIVSKDEKSAAFFKETCKQFGIESIIFAKSAAAARQNLLSRDFDLVVINLPLDRQNGETLAKNIAEKKLSIVIISVLAEHFQETAAICEKHGIIVIQKPIDKNLFWQALSVCSSIYFRIKKYQKENIILKQKIEDIRIINRAKCVLISHLNLTETQAHRHIEKQAMDTRSTRIEVSREILKMYEN